jgi:mono/diheme cytochrome c family protein
MLYWQFTRRLVPVGSLVWLVLVALSGCDAPTAHFKPNLTYVRNQQLIKEPRGLNEPAVRQQIDDVADVLAALFGTPDAPFVPAIEGVESEQLLSTSKLQFAAGPVHSDADGRVRGLYRKHCVHCHGITGDGKGPTAAFLNPYPRDYRRGIFKFKSTPSTLPPTDEDMHRILINGISGTSMPSFRLLAEDEREALVQYVKYLAIRGEVERSLLMYAATELDPGERILDLSLRKSDPAAFQEQLDIAKELAGEVLSKWERANQNVVDVPAPPADFESSASIARGKELFYTTLASCSKCHGDTALGDGQTTDYDEWTKEIEPANPAALEDYLALGALPPRNILPRNLRQGIYRGGRRPVDLFWRVKNGIAGTPMPNAAQQLSADDIWHLVDYVRSLPYDVLSNPYEHVPSNQRERM